MKRWKMLVGLLGIGLLLIAANKQPPFLLVDNYDLPDEIIATIDSSGDSTVVHYTIYERRLGGFSSLQYKFYLTGPIGDSVPGVGVDDSAVMILDFYRRGLWVAYDSVNASAIPATLEGVIWDSVGDSLINTDLRVRVEIIDSTDDTTGTITYNLSSQIFAK